MIITLPNILTFARIGMLPFLVLCFFIEHTLAHWTALGLFIVASITDYLDGYLARTLNQYSDLGKVLDPIADKLLVTIALVMLVAEQTIAGIHVCAVVLILSREIYISGLREYLSDKDVQLPVSYAAKWKTALQMISITTLLISFALSAHNSPVLNVGLILLWLASGLTLYTAYTYTQSALRQKRS
ncbi:MAG: CDP-diacylglycerol--glycerol-3-phosphate 3-phosphatidyltransferase [Pseudomonadota bacterium]